MCIQDNDVSNDKFVVLAANLLNLEAIRVRTKPSKVKQTSKGKTILRSFVQRSQYTNKYERITSEHRFLYCGSLYTLRDQRSCATPTLR